MSTQDETPADIEAQEAKKAAAKAAAKAIVQAYLEKRRAAEEGPTTWVAGDVPALQEDTLWRSLTRGGQARLLCIRATNLTQQAAAYVDASPDVAKMMGEWLIAALLMRQCLNPDERLQFYVNHAGPVGQVVVDAWEDGGARIYVKSPQEVTEAFGFLIGDGNLQVSRTFGHKVYRSTTELRGEQVQDFVMHYLLESEQILSLLMTDVRTDDTGVTVAAGFLLQLMPDGTKADLQHFLANLEPMGPLADAMTEVDPDGRAWAEKLMAGFQWDQVARVPVDYQCRCSHDRMISMIASLPRRDIADLAKGSEPLQMQCDFCRTSYEVRPGELRVLLAEPS
jgi:molecular chaperone Hsp33